MFANLVRKLTTGAAQYTPAAGLTWLMGPATPVSAARPPGPADDGGAEVASSTSHSLLSTAEHCPSPAPSAAIAAAVPRDPPPPIVTLVREVPILVPAPAPPPAPAPAPAPPTVVNPVAVSRTLILNDNRTEVTTDARQLDARQTTIVNSFDQRISAGGDVVTSASVVSTSGDHAMSTGATRTGADDAAQPDTDTDPDLQFGAGARRAGDERSAPEAGTDPAAPVAADAADATAAGDAADAAVDADPGHDLGPMSAFDGGAPVPPDPGGHDVAPLHAEDPDGPLDARHHDDALSRSIAGATDSRALGSRSADPAGTSPDEHAPDTVDHQLHDLHDPDPGQHDGFLEPDLGPEVAELP